MSETKTSAAVQAVEAMREAGVFRPFLVGAWTLAMADETGVWEPPSKAALRRKLTRPTDETPCSEKELTTAIHLAKGQGLISPESGPRRLVLPGQDEVRA